MKLKDLIRRNVKTLSPEKSCEEAAKTMRDENIGCVVVAQNGRPVGIVTDRDLVDRVMAARRDAHQVRLRDVMSRDPIFIVDERPLEEALAIMARMRVRRIATISQDGQLSGLLSLDDLLLHLTREFDAVAEVVRAAVPREEDAAVRLARA
jgi:CBS domain-containing protein